MKADPADAVGRLDLRLDICQQPKPAVVLDEALEDVQEALELALSRVDRPQEAYLDGTELERRVLNLSIFERIEIGPDGEISETVLAPVYEALRAWEPGLGRPAQGQNGSCSVDVRLSSAPVHCLVACAACTPARAR